MGGRVLPNRWRWKASSNNPRVSFLSVKNTAMLAKTTIQQRKALAFASTKGSKEQVTGDEKETWCLSLPSLTPHTIVFLCVSSIHSTLVPSLTSIPSLPNPSPPKPKFMAKQAKKRRDGGERHEWRSSGFFF